MTRGMIDAVVLSGGSLYGLDAAGGVTAVLCRQGKGAQFGGLTLPVAVQAILFDLMNGGEKDWLTQPVDKRPPYWDLGRDATLAASQDFALGTVGAGYGATTVTSKGGLGSASARTRQGFTVGALAAVNAVGSAADRRWAAFLGRALRAGRRVRRPGLAAEDCARGARRALQGPAGAGDGDHHRHGRDRRHAHQGRVQAARHHGQRRPVEGAAAGARAQRRRHGVRGGDRPAPGPLASLAAIRRCSPSSARSAADCLARAVARGVYEATALPYKTAVPDWKTRFGGGLR